jgi:uncharacterized protein (TIGR03435 family)
MKMRLQALAIALAACSVVTAQPPAGSKLEFDAVALNASAPPSSHFRPPASSRGGPGTADPTLFRCTNCDLTFLIGKAFGLQRYQFPGQTSLPDTAYEVTARVPEGTTPEQFSEMLQNLLKDRFALSFHYDKKQVQGYDLVVAKNGPNLKESTGTPHQNAEARSWHGAADGGTHEHSAGSPMVFGGRGRYSGDHLTTAGLARMISNQLAKPVDDQTGLQGKYDIALSWSDDGSHSTTHADGGGEHYAAASDGVPGPTLPVALQSQLGLKLEPKKVAATIFVIDHVDKSPASR